MRYVSIDIETTGVDRELCQVLEIGAVVEDTNNLLPLEQLPTFNILLHHDELHWEEKAKAMHVTSGLYERITTPAHLLDTKRIYKESVALLFAQFLVRHGFPLINDKVEIVASGKNFSTFDRVFLEKLPDWKKYIKIQQRVLDPTLSFVDWKNDLVPPSLHECKKRAGFTDAQVSHRAVDDALDVVKLLRCSYEAY